MVQTLSRTTLTEDLRKAAEQDAQIIGLIDYGSSSEGHADEWSDVDVALFIREDDYAAFEREWKTWAGQFGTLMLAYISGVQHPWAVYAAEPVPLRVDFAFYPESRLDVVRTLAKSPTSAESLVLYDGTGGKLTEYAAQLVGQSLRPLDEAATFDQVCGDFWYYLLRTWAKLQRGQLWAFRYDYNMIITGNLHALLRLEVGATERWRASSACVGIEDVITPERLAQLNACIPGEDVASLQAAMRRAAELGKIVCASIATERGWLWPEALAEQVEAILDR